MIDVTHYLGELEGDLRSGRDVGKSQKALAILRRWQFDDMLTDESRRKAYALMVEFMSPWVHVPPRPQRR